MVLHLDKIDPLHLRMLCALVKLAQWFWRRRFLNCVTVPTCLPSPCCARRHIGQGLASSTALHLWPSYPARSMSGPSLSFLTVQSFSTWSLESISEIP